MAGAVAFTGLPVGIGPCAGQLRTAQPLQHDAINAHEGIHEHDLTPWRRCWSPLLASAAAALSLQRSGKRSRVSLKARGGARGGEAATPRLVLNPKDQWIANLDLEGFGKEVHSLGQKLRAEQGGADNKHLQKIIFWSRVCSVVGLSTIWMVPNPITVMALSLWTTASWLMLGHHVCHGGYNKTDESGQYTSRGFAVGSVWRRLQDWFDWILPEAWMVEHNQRHHYRLGEEDDPDLVERNFETMTPEERKIWPFLSMLTWKWAYYAPNTYKELKMQEMRNKGIPLPEGFDPLAPVMIQDIMFNEKGKGLFTMREFFTRVIGPYFIFRFFLMPLPLLLINPAFYLNALGNLILADMASNLHGFIVVVPNHAGDDLYRFQRSCKPKSPTFYLRAVTSSANFPTGGDFNDFMHAWLNYQIEHHCWPDLSMLAYQKGQPQLKKICDKYGVPYVQESCFVRLKKTLDIATGNTVMKRYPDHLEREADMMVWKDQVGRKVAAE